MTRIVTTQRRLMPHRVLGGLAEFERDPIRARTAEDRERREAGPQAEAHPASAAGSTGAT